MSNKISFSKGRVDLENDFSLSFNDSVFGFLKETNYLVLKVVTNRQYFRR